MGKLRIFFYYLINKQRKNRSILSLVINILPAFVFSSQYIDTIDERKNFYIIRLKGFKHTFFWLKIWGLPLLYMLVHEQLNPLHWHYYLIPETDINAGDYVLDCGAADGIFSAIALKKGATVYAVEPSSVFFNFLKKQFHNAKNIFLYNIVLGKDNKQVYFHEEGLESRIADAQIPATTSMSLKRKMVTVDSLFHDKDKRIDFIKADLEGSELDMIKGATRTIKKYKPKIAVTTYHHVSDCSRIKRYLKKIVPGYSFLIKGISGKKGQPIMLHAYIDRSA